MEADKLKDTLVDGKTKALVDVLDETLPVVKKTEAVVNILNDVQAEVQAKRIRGTQLVETLANTLEGRTPRHLSHTKRRTEQETAPRLKNSTSG